MGPGGKTTAQELSAPEAGVCLPENESPGRRCSFLNFPRHGIVAANEVGVGCVGG